MNFKIKTPNMPFQIIKYGENLNSNKIMSMHKPVGVSQIFIIQVTKHASSYKKIETFPDPASVRLM